MKDIKETRKQISEVDQEMAALFEKRMALVRDVAEYKKTCGLPILDENREKEVVRNNSELVKDPGIRDYYVDFIKSTMKISRDYQSDLLNGIRVAYSGVEGAYAHIAARNLFQGGRTISCPSFKSAYEAVEKGEADVCVLPIENSYAGDVGLVNDLMFQGTLYLTDVYELEIRHNLMAKKGTRLSDVKTVCSHQQALSQCHSFIEKNGFVTEEYPNTAVAAKALADGNDCTKAVIASKDVADLYGLEILQPDINDNRNNSTRFGVFSKTMHHLSPSKMGNHFIIMFTVANEAGSLATTLNIIGSHGFNMRTLRSRPMKELMWNYYFFCELDGNIDTEDGRSMIRELGTVCDLLKVAGTYYSLVTK